MMNSILLASFVLGIFAPGDLNPALKVHRKASLSGGEVHVEVNHQDSNDRSCQFERLTYRNGQIQRWVIEKLALAEKGEVIFLPGNEIRLSYSKQGKMQESREPWPKLPVVVNDSIYPFILSQLPELRAGEVVRFKLPVPDRLETIGFQLEYRGEELLGSQKVILIRMKPSSFFLSLWVSPMFFLLKAESPNEFIEFRGSFLVPIEKRGKWVNLGDGVMKSL